MNLGRSHGGRSILACLLSASCIVAMSARAQSVPKSRLGVPAVNTAAARGCAAIRARVEATPGDGPVLVRSYDSASGVPPELALDSAAFSYDNALAVMALVACATPAPAHRIGDALLAAALAEQGGKPQRLRNVYRAGAVERAPLPNGWWDTGEQRWVEDANQMGTATGNAAWVALALMSLHEIDDDPRWRKGAERLADWVVTHASDTRGAGGFNGGVHGFDAAPQSLTWKSTEHNVDLVALFSVLIEDGARVRWSGPLANARQFVDAQWDAAAGRFLTGTLPDGVTANRATSGLDAQLWPLLLRDAPQAWQRALVYAERAHGISGGFDFNADRDGLWVEGSAQAALAYQAVGRDDDAIRVLNVIASERDAGGYLYATQAARITTGLAIGPASTSADFYYYRRPHLGATAWAVLAALGWNPFTLRTVEAKPVAADGIRAKEKSQ